MNFLKIYFNEVISLHRYIFLIILALAASYSVFFFLEVETVAKLGSEDNFFEWMTAIAFLGSSVMFALAWFTQKRAAVFIFLSFLFLLGFGEEISWGQRVIEFETPEKIRQLNVQREMTIHNLEIFNSESSDGQLKQGISRILEINFLFKLFTIFPGVMLPLAVFHNRSISSLAKRFKFPIPPVSLTIFFAVNWIIFKVISEYFLVPGQVFQYYDTNTEIFEFIASFIILVTSIYLYRYRRIVPSGYDFKQVVLRKSVKLRYATLPG